MNPAIDVINSAASIWPVWVLVIGFLYSAAYHLISLGERE